MTEAEALSEIYDDYLPDADEFYKEVKSELKMDARVYAINKKAKVGTVCKCAGPKCNHSFVKKSYQQAFCRTKCKDQFWNRVRFWNNETAVELLLERIDEARYGERNF